MFANALKFRSCLLILLFCSMQLFAFCEDFVIPADAKPDGEWHGFSKYTLSVQEKSVTVVAPREAAPGRPWVWHGEFFGHKPDPDIELLERGFHLVYMSIPNMLGSPGAVDYWNHCYQHVTREFKLSSKVALVGLSRGGLYCYNWAIANPDKVACIYGDAPVCDFKSWPGGKGTGVGSESNWKLVMDLWNFQSEEQALSYTDNPVDRLRTLAEAEVPLLHVFGDADDVVPWEENTGLIAQRYHELGGEIELIRKPGIGHHPHGLDDSTPIVDFIQRHASPPKLKIQKQDGQLTVYEVNSPFQKGQTTISVLSPDEDNGNSRRRMLFVLPVEAANGNRWGDSIQAIRQADLHNEHNLICVFPTFSDLPWYADHPTDAQLQQETYFIETVLPIVRSQVPAGRHDRDGRLLVGFSKSGWGAWSLILRHPDRFGRAAAWDAPLMMDSHGKYGSGPIFGDGENFQQYKLTALVQHFDPEGAPPRLIHGGFDNFRDHHQEMEQKLKKLEIPSIYVDGPQREHHWESGWLSDLVEKLVSQ